MNKLIFWYAMLCWYLIIPYLAMVVSCLLYEDSKLLSFLGGFGIVWLTSLIPLGIIGAYLDKLWESGKQK